MDKTFEEFENDIFLLETAVAERPNFHKAVTKLMVDLDLRNVTNKELGLFSATQIALNYKLTDFYGWEKSLLKTSELIKQCNYWINTSHFSMKRNGYFPIKHNF